MLVMFREAKESILSAETKLSTRMLLIEEMGARRNASACLSEANVTAKRDVNLGGEGKTAGNTNCVCAWVFKREFLT